MNLTGYRKLIACLFGTACSTACIMLGKLDGAQFVTCLGICVGGFLTANVIKKPTQA